jgi:WS/DGAT/MGAT family acyltransferase
MLSSVFQHGPKERPVIPDATPPRDPAPTRRRLMLPALRSFAPRAAHLPRLVNRSLRATRIGRERAREGLGGPAKAFDSPPTRFNARFTAHRTCAWAPLAMRDLKAVRAAFGCTVNDVLIAVCSGAVRSYLDQHGELPRASLSATVPVSIRNEHELDDYGNRLTSWFVMLATDVADPVERLAAIHTATHAARASQTARHSETLVEEWMGYKLLWRRWIAFGGTAAGLTRRPTFNLIVSNVRGPDPLWFDGAPVEEIVSVGELAMGLGLNLTGWSYRDQMVVGASACPEHVPDLWDLVDGLPVALAELVEAARIVDAPLTDA